MKKYFIILQGFFDIAKSLPLQKFLSVPNNKVSSKKFIKKVIIVQKVNLIYRINR